MQAVTPNEYPLVTEDGETILDDGFLVDYIRDKCGDEVARMVEKKIADNYCSPKVIRKFADIAKTVDSIAQTVTEMEDELDALSNRVKE